MVLAPLISLGRTIPVRLISWTSVLTSTRWTPLIARLPLGNTPVTQAETRAWTLLPRVVWPVPLYLLEICAGLVVGANDRSQPLDGVGEFGR